MTAWTAVRFAHLVAAGTWLGIQVTLLAVVPALRRTLGAEPTRVAVRAAGRRLAATGLAALAVLAVSGVALGRHEAAAADHAGVVTLKQALLAGMVALLAGHAAVRGRRLRVAASAAMLLSTLAAVYAGAWLAES
jgi:uncharacterized membrane protein